MQCWSTERVVICEICFLSWTSSAGYSCSEVASGFSIACAGISRIPCAARRTPCAERAGERERGQGMRAHAVSAERSTASPGPRYHTHLSNCVGCESARRSGAVTNEACLRPAPQIPAIGHVIIGPGPRNGWSPSAEFKPCLFLILRRAQPRQSQGRQ